MTSEQLIATFQEAVEQTAQANSKLNFSNPESVLLTLVNGLIAIKQREEEESEKNKPNLSITPALASFPRSVG